MDAVTLAMAKKYTDSQRLGYSAYETFDQVSFDGNIADRATIPGEALGLSGTFVHASDSVFDGGVAHKANVYTQNHWNYNVKNLRVDKSDDGIWFLFGELVASGVIYEGERLLAMSFGAAFADALGCPAGTYVWTDTIEGICLYVGVFEGSFTETIHPIDPKFLPGVCLPVVELPAETMEFDTKNSAVLDYCAEQCIPAILNLTSGGTKTSALMLFFDKIEGIVSAFHNQELNLLIERTEGGWVASVSEG